jgi:tetratricopeptide (TPR) repeat protein
MMTLTKLKLATICGVAIAGLAAPLVVQHQSRARLREENQSLRQQVEQLAQLSTENERLSNMLAQAITTLATSRDQTSELLRLRGEVGRLRQESKEAGRLQQENAQLRAASARRLSGSGAAPPTGSDISQPLPLYVRIIKVNTDDLLQQMKSSTTGTETESNQEVVRHFLKDNGIEFEPPKSIFLNDTNGALYVRTTLADLDKVETLLMKLARPQSSPGTPDVTSAAEKVQDGRLLFEQGKLDEAEVSFKEALQQDPWNQAANYYLNQVTQARHKEQH